MFKIHLKSLKVVIILFLVTILVNITSTIVNAQMSESKPTAETVDAVWDALSVFEGSYKTVTPDFDGQGMSIGIAQWNVGKSFPSVKKIILANNSTAIKTIMPNYGNRFIHALENGKDATFSFVRSLQNIKNPNSFEANIRGATWSNNGKVFASELGKLLTTKESITAQREFRTSIFFDGWRNANKWAVAYRGENATPTLKEIAYFVDTQIFNGGWRAFKIEYEKIPSDKVKGLLKDTISYLKTANDGFLLHKKAARNNADLLDIESLNESEAALFANAYVLSQRINAPKAKQFRLTVINRRAAILFGQAFYSDRDNSPIKITLQ